MYIALIAFHYLCILILLTPWLLLCGGAARRIWWNNNRLSRLQLEGALIMFIGTVVEWVLYDAKFGVDRLHITTWSDWVTYCETCSFIMGLLFFGLGLFLERRPRPGLKPWPSIGKKFLLAGIITGLALGAYLLIKRRYPYLELPWRTWRAAFSGIAYPFALVYLWTGTRSDEPPAE